MHDDLVGKNSLRRFPVPALVIGALLIVSGSPGAAQTVESRYTKTKACRTRVLDKETGASVSICPGLGGLVTVVSEDDIRQTVSVGATEAAARREPAASAFFGPPSAAGETIEWRSRGGRPFALIQRWSVGGDDRETASVLVVTRLPPGPVCHVAYVDARANKDANVLARKVADERAAGFDCAKQAAVVGQRGRAFPDLRP